MTDSPTASVTSGDAPRPAVSAGTDGIAGNAASAGPGQTTITVALCTYRRPAIVEALRSLAGQELRDIRMRVIVVDNDDRDSARAAVEDAASALKLDLAYHHVPGSNISLARNACLDACETQWLAFIDDDETATAGWLQHLIDTARKTLNVAAVFGPMRAIYGATAPTWLKDGDFHSTTIVFVNNEIRTGYTTNALINLGHPAARGKRFNLALGKSGGEDTDLFDRIYQDGGRFAFTADALVEEILPVERQSLGWFLQRRFRSGQTHGRLLARRHPGGIGRLKQVAIAAAKAVFCLAMAGVNLPRAVTWRRWLLRGALHAGAIAYLCGRAEAALYQQPPIIGKA